MNQEFLDFKKDDDYNTKKWWIRKLNDILEGSEYEAIDNPTVKEKNVVVVKKGSTKQHFIGVWLYKDPTLFGAFTRQRIYDEAKQYYDKLIPEPDKVQHNEPHFRKRTSPEFVFFFAEVLVGKAEWIPSLSEYDPKITKEMWLDFFYRSGRFNNNYQHMLAAMMKLGGQASCIQLEERFGQTASHYSMTAVHMSEQAQEFFGCSFYTNENGEEKKWPILFVGKKASKDERGSFIWKIRPPLKEALIEFGIKQEGEYLVTSSTVNYDKNLILYGPPGTGKTYSSAIYAVAICDGKSIDELTDYEAVMARYNELKEEGRIAFTTFHQSYGYEEFIEGIKPLTDEQTKAISYSIEQGAFKKFCESARKKSIEGNRFQIPEDAENQANTKPYVFIIDEINRGNISKIFGELITLIEDTKREGQPEAASAILPYSGKPFSVPDNVYILGTMNTADRSIALMDTALRRRFQFEELMPDADVLREIGADKVGDLDVAKMLEAINERITLLYDREHTIGHAFFTKLKDEPTVAVLSSIFKKSVIPLLQEYFYEDYQKIQLVLGDNAKADDSLKFIKDERVVLKNIFKGSAEDVIDIEKKYSINEEAFDNLLSYQQII